MSNNLSQEEINALLAGAASGDTSSENAPDSPPDSEISESAVSGQDASPGDAPAEAPGAQNAQTALEPVPTDELKDEPGFEDSLTPDQRDAMGEVGNISMGTSATTLSTLLNKKVDITTPHVIVTNMRSLSERFPLPFVSVEVTYTMGLAGNNLLFLKPEDVMIITDLMLGGDGTNTQGELGDLHLSAISEAMNQMVGSASTSLSQIIGSPIDISPPTARFVENVATAGEPNFLPDEPIIMTVFNMEVQGLIHSQIMQIVPLDFGKLLLKKIMSDDYVQELTGSPEAAAPTQPAVQNPAPAAPAAPAPAPASPSQTPPPPGPVSQLRPERVVSVEPVQYASFDAGAAAVHGGENLNLLLDVPLQVSVELGKSRKFVKEILDFNVGTVVVLDKLAGEMVDIYVNGKLIAKGEVVVIEDSYGARITEIVTSSGRIDSLM